MGISLYMLLLCFLNYNISLSYGKLVFEPGSDVGYIVPDENEKNSLTSDEETEYSINKQRLKRQFWNSIFDDFSGKKVWDGLQSMETAELDKTTARTAELDKTTARTAELDKTTARTAELDKTTARAAEKKGGNVDYGSLPEMLKDNIHGVAMGIPSKECDDGKMLLEIDWDGSPTSYTCYTPKFSLEIRDLEPLETCYDVSSDYRPRHYCMKDPIVYNTTLPTFGPHRPLWPIFGEYRYVPTQRWLHSIEHGSIVMLYHPCAEPILVMELKKIVRRCIYKHVISASMAVSIERPLVLLAWGCRLEMAMADEDKVMKFIKKRALNGPEGSVSKQGQYSEELLVKATPPKGSNVRDENLCPDFDGI